MWNVTAFVLFLFASWVSLAYWVAPSDKFDDKTYFNNVVPIILLSALAVLLGQVFK